jgi:hypothetical protein
MSSQTVITIVILLLLATLFLVAYINSKKIPVRKKEKIFEKLELLSSQVNSDDEYARRDAIIRLDNVLGQSLNIRLGNDSSCGDNLKISKKLFDKKTYQQIWDAHKVRNNIVHNDENISKVEALELFKIYKFAVKQVLK